MELNNENSGEKTTIYLLVKNVNFDNVKNLMEINANSNWESFDRNVLFILEINENYNDITWYFLQKNKKKYKESSKTNFIVFENINTAGVSLLFLVCSDLPNKNTYSSGTSIYNKISQGVKKKNKHNHCFKIFRFKKMIMFSIARMIEVVKKY